MKRDVYLAIFEEEKKGRKSYTAKCSSNPIEQDLGENIIYSSKIPSQKIDSIISLLKKENYEVSKRTERIPKVVDRAVIRKGLIKLLS